MNLISGHGQPSELMIVADYSDKHDAFTMKALSGKPGNDVSKYLAGVGVPGGIEYCYRTSYLKLPLVGVETRNKKKRKEIIDNARFSHDWESILRDEISQIKPNVIIPLGELALNALTAEKGINNFRGSILPINPTWRLDFTPKVVPTLHPRQIQENYIAHWYVPVDYKRAWELRNHKEQYKRRELLWIARTPTELKNYWDRAKNGKFLTLDIETYLNYITCIGFCTDGYEAVCVPMMENMSPVHMRLMWELIYDILKSDIRKVNQNISYDIHQLESFGFKVNNIYDDTMLMFHTLYPEFPKNLGFQTSLYTDQPYYKDEGRLFDPRMGLDQLYYYNAKDALVTWQIYEKQVKDAKELRVYGFHRANIFDNNLFGIYRRINTRGIRIDDARRQTLKRKYTAMREAHLYNLEQLYGKPLNINSPKQVASFIYDFLKCPEMTHVTPGGDDAPNTDAESLEELCINKIKSLEVKRAVKEVIVTRKLTKVLEYIDTPLHPDGRLRTTYRLEGTKSGRTSGSCSQDCEYGIDRDGELGPKNKLHRLEYGSTLHNIPKRPYECEEFEGEIYGKDIPSMFIPSPGYVFVEGDGKSAEAGVVFVLAEDWEMLDYMYNRKAQKVNEYGIKDDIHTLTAMLCRDIKFEEVTEFARENYGKRGRHAGHFDMGAWRLMMMIHRPLQECKDVLDRFHQKNPKIRLIYHGDIQRFVTNNGYLVSPHGRRRDFFGRRNNKQFWKEVYSNYSQATVSDHTKFSMPLLHAEIPSAEFCIEKHDSILAEIPVEKSESYCAAFKSIYERPIDFRQGSITRNFQLVIPADIKVGELEASWGDLKGWKG